MYYAIRDKRAFKTLPNYGTRKGRGGWTNDEPVSPSIVPPRLFMQRHHAERALKAWLKGVHYVKIKRSHDFFGNEDDREEFHVRPAPERCADDMEVVEVTMQIGPPIMVATSV